MSANNQKETQNTASTLTNEATDSVKINEVDLLDDAGAEKSDQHSKNLKNNRRVVEFEAIETGKKQGESNNGAFKQFFSPQIHPHWSEISGLAPLKLDESQSEPSSAMNLNFAEPFVIGICGGNCAGKMDAVESMIKVLGRENVTVVMQENFYSRVTNDKENIQKYNFDDPEATDWEYMIKGLETLLDKKATFVSPIYDFMEQKRSEQTIVLTPKPVIIVEGLLILHYQGIRDKCNLKIFIDTDDDIRLSRRVIKDVYRRGKNVKEVIERYEKFVKPAYEKFVQPSKKYADIIIPEFGKPILKEIDEVRNPKDKALQEVESYDNKAILMIIEQLQVRLKKDSEMQAFKKPTLLKN